MVIQQNTLRLVKLLTLGIACVVLSACTAPAPPPRVEPVMKPEKKPVEIPVTTSSEEARMLFLEGRQAAENLRFALARELFNRAIEADSGFALAYLYRSGASVARSTQEGRQDLEKAVDLAPATSKGEQLMIEAGKSLYLDSDRAGWSQRTKDLSGMYPQDKRVRNALAFVYQTYYDDRDKAIAEWEASVAIDPNYPPPYNSLGYAYRAKGQYDRAEEAFANYIRLLPNEPNPYDSMGELLMKLGRYTEAVDHFRKAMELDSTFAASHRSIGIALCWLGQFDEGRKAVQTAIDRAATPAGKADLHGSLANAWLYEGDLEEARAVLDQAVEFCAESGLSRRAAGFHIGRAWVSYEMGELDQADSALAESLRQLEDPQIFPYYRDLYTQRVLYLEALILAERGDFDAALATAAKHEEKVTARQDPSMEEHHGLLGLISAKRGDHEEAVAHFQQADDEDPYVLYHWALAESEAGSADKAAELFRKSALWNEDTWSYSFVRARALAALGE